MDKTKENAIARKLEPLKQFVEASAQGQARALAESSEKETAQTLTVHGGDAAGTKIRFMKHQPGNSSQWNQLANTHNSVISMTATGTLEGYIGSVIDDKIYYEGAEEMAPQTRFPDKDKLGGQPDDKKKGK